MPDNIFGRHFQGALSGCGNPGLKPWAILFSHFMAKRSQSLGLRDTRSTIRSPNKRLRIGVFLVRRSPMNILICFPRSPGLIVTEKWANSQPYEFKREGAIGI